MYNIPIRIMPVYVALLDTSEYYNIQIILYKRRNLMGCLGFYLEDYGRGSAGVYVVYYGVLQLSEFQ